MGELGGSQGETLMQERKDSAILLVEDNPHAWPVLVSAEQSTGTLGSGDGYTAAPAARRGLR
jgi:hypothetical protein